MNAIKPKTSGSYAAYGARLGKLFVHDAYLSELTSLLDQLKAGLSATVKVQGNRGKCTVSELATKIKAIKAAPQRVRQKQSSAEEPVTARIRRGSCCQRETVLLFVTG